MAASFSLPTVLANLAAGNQALGLIDGDFTACYNPLVALGTFGNFYTDVGAANAYAITVSSPQTVALAAGLPIQFKASAANTGASTLAINALGAKSILNPNGTALSNAQIPANGIVSVMYDGTQFLLLGANPTYSTVTNSLAGDVSLNNTANYFDGPSCAQGTVGTWLATGQVTLADVVTASGGVIVKLWDGTTVFSSTSGTLLVNAPLTISLSALCASPAANLRISVRDFSATTAKIVFNQSGFSKDSTLAVVRIA